VQFTTNLSTMHAAHFERNLLPCVKPAATDYSAAHYLDAPVSIRASGVAVPHPEKVKDGKRGVNERSSGFAGEDAYFYTPGSHATFGLGVSDGVYMWREHGIDSGVLSRALMDTARSMVEGGCSDVMRIAEACDEKISKGGVFGSATLCLAVVDRQAARMHSACLGDSGIMVIGTADEGHEVCCRAGLWMLTVILMPPVAQHICKHAQLHLGGALCNV
jgi:hypothetical protein